MSKFKLFLLTIIKTIQLIWQHKPSYICIITIFTIFNGVIPLAQLYIGKLLIDAVFTLITINAQLKNISPVFFYIFFEAGITLVSFLINKMKSYYRLVQGTRISDAITIGVYRSVLKFSYSSFDDPQFYDTFSKAQREAGSMPLTMIESIFTLITQCISMMGIFIILLSYNYIIVFLILITTIPTLLIEMRHGKLVHDIYNSRVKENRNLFYIGNLLTSKNSIQEIHLFQLGNIFIEKIIRLKKKFRNIDRRIERNKILVQIFLNVFSVMSSYSFLIFFIFEALNNRITLGDLSMYRIAIGSLQSSLNYIMGYISEIYTNSLRMNNLFRFFEEEKRQVFEISKLKNSDIPGKLQALRQIQTIEFDDVWFKYPAAQRYTLSSISFKIDKGEKILLFGRNGTGKTTLIKLLSGLYQPTKGRILINNIDMQLFSPDSLRKRISVIFQDYIRYQWSARENIRFGNIETDEQVKIVNAAKKGQAHDFIKRLPKAYDTKLGKIFDEDGCELSQGQWQRIALSRAFVRDADLLILDEPTASLDMESEYNIYKNFYTYTAHKTCILISHRWSTIKCCKRIIILHDGKIAADDSHDNLIIKNDIYREFHIRYGSQDIKAAVD